MKELEYILQQSLSQENDQFSDSWATDGWCKDTPEYDLSPINVPVYTQYVENDELCPVDINRSIINNQVCT